SPDAPVVATVGAGAAAVAGSLVAQSSGFAAPERLALAVAYGAVAVSLPGTTIPARTDVHEDVSTVVEL
ncbi:MAG: 1-phosphofructokinase, partial [Actinomyces sp.]|nr:1-phosphofructokinase [Actinomyces sp.]